MSQFLQGLKGLNRNLILLTIGLMVVILFIITLVLIAKSRDGVLGRLYNSQDELGNIRKEINDEREYLLKVWNLVQELYTDVSNLSIQLESNNQKASVIVDAVNRTNFKLDSMDNVVSVINSKVKDLCANKDSYYNDNSTKLTKLLAGNDSIRAGISDISRRDESLINALVGIDKETKSLIASSETIRKKIDDDYNSIAVDTAKLLSGNESLRTGLSGFSKDTLSNMGTVAKLLVEETTKIDTLQKGQDSLYKYTQDNVAVLSKNIYEVGNNVGEIRKVFKTPKSRGMVGEWQLGITIENVLPDAMYERNVKLGSGIVEYAIKLVGDDSNTYIPVDAKFPTVSYEKVIKAYNACEDVEDSENDFKKEVLKAAKDISDKYIDPPSTTDFAVMYLPSEGMYLLAIELGMIEEVYKKYKICISGPSTLVALLSSILLGTKLTWADKQGKEVYSLMQDTRKELQNYTSALVNVKQEIENAQEGISKLVGVRTSKMGKMLDKIGELDVYDKKD